MCLLLKALCEQSQLIKKIILHERYFVFRWNGKTTIFDRNNKLILCVVTRLQIRRKTLWRLQDYHAVVVKNSEKLLLSLESVRRYWWNNWIHTSFWYELQTLFSIAYNGKNYIIIGPFFLFQTPLVNVSGGMMQLDVIVQIEQLLLYYQTTWQCKCYWPNRDINSLSYRLLVGTQNSIYIDFTNYECLK